MTIHTMLQRSDEWYQIRAGRVTGSCAEAILKERKRGNGELAIRADLRKRLVAERLTGRPIERLTYKPSQIQHGIDTEAAAFSAYEWETELIVERVGFVAHDDLMAGCSPDGVVLVDGAIVGGIELKCPEPTTHLDYLRAGVIPEDYRPQMIHALWITGAPWWDFVSFDDRFADKGLRLFRRRLDAKDVDLAAYELAVRMFLAEVERDVDAARSLATVQV